MIFLFHKSNCQNKCIRLLGPATLIYLVYKVYTDICQTTAQNKNLQVIGKVRKSFTNFIKYNYLKL